MLDLKKYFTEGLIQVAILLSLAGIRVDVDPYLPPLGRILLGPSSTVTHTQFHNLQNVLDGYNLHAKSVDLDGDPGFFSVHRLMSWVRSLDHLQVPAAELEAWLVHREPENGVSLPSQMGFLEDGGLEDVEDPSELSMRLGSGGELGYDLAEDDGAVEYVSRVIHLDQEELFKEDEDGVSFLWEQEPEQNVPQEQLESRRSHLLSFYNEEEDELMVDGWRNTNPFHNQMFEENVQWSGVREDTSLSIEECLRLVDASFSSEDPESTGSDGQNVEEHELQFQRPLLSERNSTFSLEQQWQDVLAVMESQEMDTAETIDNSHHSISELDGNTGSMENLIHQDVSLHQATLQTSTVGPNTNSMEETCCPNNQNTSLETSDVNDPFEDSDIIDLLLTPGVNSSVSSNYLPCTLFDQQNLSSHLEPLLDEPLLDEAMFDEISLMDLALEEFSQAQFPQFEERTRTDSDSGLSLNYSQSPASPNGSESSSSSSSSSCSSSPSSPSPNLIPEDGAVGSVRIKEEEEEGAIGGFMPEETKMCHTDFLEARQFHHLPWLENIGHDHTYNQPQTCIQKKSPKHSFDEPLKDKTLEQLRNRDEKRARLMNIPFPTEFIINSPVDEFNQLLAKYHLNEAQLMLIRDIRRRGKNKMAAQNCRRRKLDVVLGLQRSIDGLRRHRARLLRENSEVRRSVMEMKQRLNSVYQELCGKLREQGSLCSDYNFTSQDEGTSPEEPKNRTALVTRRTDSNSRRKLNKRRKDKK